MAAVNLDSDRKDSSLDSNPTKRADGVKDVWAARLSALLLGFWQDEDAIAGASWWQRSG